MKDYLCDKGKKVADAVIRRLPRYYRQLCYLESQNISRISSNALGESLDLKATQIRQDLNSFGGFGQQGYGYPVSELRDIIADILSINSQWKMVIVGAGNIGRALSGYDEFMLEGFQILALFDNDKAMVDKQFGRMPVYDVSTLADYIKENHVDIVALAVPSRVTQSLADLSIRAGANAIWNFAPVDVFCDDVVVENIHLTDSLMALSYNLGQKLK